MTSSTPQCLKNIVPILLLCLTSSPVLADTTVPLEMFRKAADSVLENLRQEAQQEGEEIPEGIKFYVGHTDPDDRGIVTVFYGWMVGGERSKLENSCELIRLHDGKGTQWFVRTTRSHPRELREVEVLEVLTQERISKMVAP